MFMHRFYSAHPIAKAFVHEGYRLCFCQVADSYIPYQTVRQPIVYSISLHDLKQSQCKRHDHSARLSDT